MIPSAKSRWFTAWFASQAHARLRRSFGVLKLAGREHLEGALARGPVLVVSNHCAWWDPLVVLTLTHRLVPADGYAMMDADNLRRRPFFAKIGAFGVDRSSRRDGAEAIRYAQSLLDGPGRLVWLFPQGQERPLHERPLRFFGGAARVALRKPEVTVIPVALSYAFESTEAASAYVSVGAPVSAQATSAATRAAQVDAVEAQIDQVKREQSRPGREGFEIHPLQRPGWLGGVAERVLAGLTRPFVPGLVEPAPALAAPRRDGG